MAAIASRKNAEAPVPMMLPTDLEVLKAALRARRPRAAMPATAAAIASECPSEKNSPTATGFLPSCISLRTTLSMEAI